MNDQELIDAMHVLRLQKGDILTLHAACEVTHEQVSALTSRLKEIAPEGVECIVLSGGASVTVQRYESRAET